ncbi:MAG: VanW family protein [Actinobacteria bacterium]|nr:VanW family protein [Actinomycetota bacterium]
MRRRVLLLAVTVVACGVVLGFAFSGSPTTIADGVRIDGTDVGGLRVSAARSLLEHRAAALANKPVVFAVGARRFRIRPVELGVQSDWAAAVDSAQRQGSGFAPIRGFRRIGVDVFGADVTPSTSVLTGALQYELGRIASAVNRPPTDASLALKGARVVVVPAKIGVTLDRAAASTLIVHELAALDRSPEPVPLPVRTTQPHVRLATLQSVRRQVSTALSAPVRLDVGKTRFVLTPAKLAPLLQLPAGGRASLQIGGPAADRWLQQLGATVDKPPRDAAFAVDGSSVRIVPDRPGVSIDAVGAARAVLAAALKRRPTFRVAQLPVQTVAAGLTTAKARTMGVTGLVSTYTTDYGGVPNRIHNVQLVARLVNDKLIAPGAEFSFNKTTGERSAAKGFLVAPVIVNGELTTGLGGGVCQVSTTVFNAAFEAGVKITARTNHALYISHYPLGRDATVDYPDVDLRFVNDTGHWMLLRTFVGASSLTVSLYGTPTGRRVVSTTTPLVAHGKIKVKKTIDRSLKPGEAIVDDPGEPVLTTSVTRDVYTKSGKLLYHDVWDSYYRASPELERVGPKPKKTPSASSATQPPG